MSLPDWIALISALTTFVGTIAVATINIINAIKAHTTATVTALTKVSPPQ